MSSNSSTDLNAAEQGEQQGEQICKAAGSGERQEVLRLIRRGISPEARDLNGVTPLFRSAAGGHHRIVDDLLLAGASVNITNSRGGTALHAAAANGFCAIVTVLLEMRAMVNRVSDNGFTPLHAAAEGHPAVVTLLLEAKADPTILDKQGLSAIDYAKEEEHGEVEAILRDWDLHPTQDTGQCLIRVECEARGSLKLKLEQSTTLLQLRRLVAQSVGYDLRELELWFSKQALPATCAAAGRTLQQLRLGSRCVLVAKQSSSASVTVAAEAEHSQPATTKHSAASRSSCNPSSRCNAVREHRGSAMQQHSGSASLDSLPDELLSTAVLMFADLPSLARFAATRKAHKRAAYSEWLWGWQYYLLAGGWVQPPLANTQGDSHRKFRLQLSRMGANGWRKKLRLETNWAQGSYAAVELVGHSKGIWCCAVLRTGVFATGSEDGTIRIWSGTDEEVLHGHGGTVKCLYSSGRTLVSGSLDGTARVWRLPRAGNAEETKCIATLSGHSRGVRSVTCTPTAHRTITAAEDSTVRVWDNSEGNSDAISVLREHSGKLHQVSMMTGSTAVSGGADGLLCLWDLNKEKCLARFDERDRGWVGSFGLSKDCIISGHKDGAVCVWDVRKRQSVAVLDHHTGNVQQVNVHAAPSNTFVTASRDGTVAVWDSRAMKLRSVCSGHSDTVVCLQSDRAKIVSGSWDGTVRVWAHGSGQLVDTISEHGGHVRALGFDQAGILMSGDSNGKLLHHNFNV